MKVNFPFRNCINNTYHNRIFIFIRLKHFCTSVAKPETTDRDLAAVVIISFSLTSCHFLVGRNATAEPGVWKLHTTIHVLVDSTLLNSNLKLPFMFLYN